MNNFLHRSLREERIAWVPPKTITQKSKQMLSLFYTQACEKQAWTTCARWNWLAESPANVISLLQLMPPSSNSKHRVCPENCLSVVPINTVSLSYLMHTSSSSKQRVCPIKLCLRRPHKYCLSPLPNAAKQQQQTACVSHKTVSQWSPQILSLSLTLCVQVTAANSVCVP